MAIFNEKDNAYEVKEISYWDMMAVLALQEQANSDHLEALDKTTKITVISSKIAVTAKQETPSWLTCR